MGPRNNCTSISAQTLTRVKKLQKPVESNSKTNLDTPILTHICWVVIATEMKTRSLMNIGRLRQKKVQGSLQLFIQRWAWKGEAIYQPSSGFNHNKESVGVVWVDCDDSPDNWPLSSVEDVLYQERMKHKHKVSVKTVREVLLGLPMSIGKCWLMKWRRLVRVTSCMMHGPSLATISLDCLQLTWQPVLS